MSFSNIVKLLGDILLWKNNSVTKTEVVCSKSKVLGLYFSAFLCPSCVAFTPDLIQFYENCKKAKGKDYFEIIFLSSDADEKQFSEYLRNMPWSALPFNDRERQIALTKKFHVQNIPTLILLDAESCDVITSHGKSCVLDDPKGFQFPWKLRDPIEVFQEITLVSSKGENVNFKSLTPHIKGIYFSAHWCPPCKAFTPILIKLYKKLQKMNQQFEVIFISSDLSDQSFAQYFAMMPWLAVPYNEEQRRKELAHLYGVGGIPSLIILDENNSVITTEGRTEVNDDPEGEDFPWRPKLVDELAEKHISKLNEELCLILFTDCEEKELDAAHYILMPVAEEYKARKQRAIVEETSIPHLNFFYAGDAEICDSVRDAVQLDDQVPYLVILDMHNGKKYFLEGKKEVTSEVVRKFVRDYLSGKLTSYSVVM